MKGWWLYEASANRMADFCVSPKGARGTELGVLRNSNIPKKTQRKRDDDVCSITWSSHPNLETLLCSDSGHQAWQRYIAKEEL